MSSLCLEPPRRLRHPPIVQDDYASTAITVLEHSGLESPIDELIAADGVHHLGNLLSLSCDAGFLFEHLYL